MVNFFSSNVQLGLTVLSALSAPVSAYWRMSCPGTLLLGRLDPIVSPGKVAGHVHNILGGNAFSPTMSEDISLSATCTTCTIKGDMSNYWIPQLYYQAADGTFTAVNSEGGTVYYQQRSSYPGAQITAFPRGLRMTAGNPFRRSYDSSSFADQAISHHCLDYSGPDPPETPELPQRQCPDGIRSQVYFPSCWNGKDLDSPDHQSHMAYPTQNYNAGQCPDSHPVPVMGVFYEFIYNVANKDSNGNALYPWHGSTQPFVYAMGDPTGYGLHGDFLSGWDTNVLQNGINKKTTNDFSAVNEVTYEGIFEYPDVYGQNCALPQMVNEEIQGPLKALPGCNPVSMNPVESNSCGATTQLSLVTSTIFTDVTKTLDFAYVGCGADNIADRAFPTQIAGSNSMTVESCIQSCKAAGFTYAGLEYSTQCFCGNSIPAAAQPPAGGMGKCTMKCGGNANEICGDAGFMSIYKNCNGGACTNAVPSTPGLVDGSFGSAPASSPQQPAPAANPSPSAVVAAPQATTTLVKAPSPTPQSAPAPAYAPSSGSSSSSSSSVSSSGWTNAGCYYDPVFPRALSGITLAWWGQAITTSNCQQHCASKGFSISGTEYGQQCFCGNSLSPSTKIADSKCNMKCAGDASQTCGGPNALTIMMKGNGSAKRAQPKPKPLKKVSRVAKREVLSAME